MARRGRLGLALTLLVAAGAVVGIQVADPVGGPRAPAVEYDGPPNRLAQAAIEQPLARDHTMVWSAVDGNDAVPRVHYRVDATDRQVRAVGAVTDPPFVTFASEHASWQGPAGALAWHYATWHDLRTTYAHTELLGREAADVRVLERNTSAVVLRVNDTDTATAVFTGTENVTETARGRERGVRSHLTIHVDRGADAPARVVYVTSERRNGSRERSVSVHEYEWRPVDVRRPPGAGYTLREFVADLADVRP